jgi:hypothetical protein
VLGDSAAGLIQALWPFPSPEKFSPKVATLAWGQFTPIYETCKGGTSLWVVHTFYQFCSKNSS